MNGLEAIDLMKQGKMVVSREDRYSDIVFKIIDNNVCCKHPIEDSDFEVDGCFDFGSTYEEYIEPKPLTGWERVEGSNKYNFIDSCCVVESSCEMACNVDNKRYELTNYFSTKEKATEINFKQTLFRKLQRFSDENGDEMELIHNKYYDEYFLRVEDKFVEVNYEILNKFVDKFLQYNNYFED